MLRDPCPPPLLPGSGLSLCPAALILSPGEPSSPGVRPRAPESVLSSRTPGLSSAPSCGFRGPLSEVQLQVSSARNITGASHNTQCRPGPQKSLVRGEGGSLPGAPSVRSAGRASRIRLLGDIRLASHHAVPHSPTAPANPHPRRGRGEGKPRVSGCGRILQGFSGYE